MLAGCEISSPVQDGYAGLQCSVYIDAADPPQQTAACSDINVVTGVLCNSSTCRAENEDSLLWLRPS